eukprot:12523682-Heterocapsa_arctica.AAC.1
MFGWNKWRIMRSSFEADPVLCAELDLPSLGRLFATVSWTGRFVGLAGRGLGLEGAGHAERLGRLGLSDDVPH